MTSIPDLPRRNIGVGLALLLLVSACSDSASTPAGPDVLVDADARFRGLQSIGDKELFASTIRDALLNQYRGGGVTLLSVDGAAVPEASADTDAGSTTAGSTTAGASSSTADFTGTNVQEVGVDEADRVKTDGEFLYVLSAESGGAVGPLVDLPALDSSPIGPPRRSRIRILSLDDEAADASLVATVDIGGGAYADGLYLHTGNDFKSLIVTSSTLGGYWGYWYDSVQFHAQTSTIQKLDVKDPKAVSVSDTLTLDGQIVSSRRVGKYLYIATRYYPQVPGIQPLVTDQEIARDLINNVNIDAVLPTVTRESDGSKQALADAERCFVAQKPVSGYYSPDIITLAVVDLEAMKITDSVCYLGSTETLYASTNAAYLATTEFGYVSDVISTDGIAVDPDGVADVAFSSVDPQITTDIHQFDFDGGALRYAGSGVIEGHLGWNIEQKPFRMSEKDGYLRVASYNGRWNSNESPVLISILKPGDNRELQLIARLPNDSNPEHIGKPGEQLHASRFLGDKAYLVTFLQTDPLYVVDLSDPYSPVIAGELEIDGYSDYLHPIDENYLLGIGKGAIPAGSPQDGFRGAFAQGIKLSLFDVSDPQSPREIQSIEIGKRGSDSEALRNPHGISVQRATASHPTRVSFSISVNDIPNEYSSGPGGWYDWRETGLFGFEINTGANAGIVQRGQMIVERRSDQQPWGPLRYNDRSVLVNDAVYYIHGEQVFGAKWNSMSVINGPR